MQEFLLDLPNDEDCVCGTSSTAVLQVQEFLLDLPNDEDCVFGTSSRDKGKLHLVYENHLLDHFIHNPLRDFRHVLSEFKSSVVTSVEGITLILVEVRSSYPSPLVSFHSSHQL